MRQNKGYKFWNKEYGDKSKQHLALSNNPSEDLIKFAKWLDRNSSFGGLTARSNVLDLGCGNGRNLIYLAKTYGISGTGYDISNIAINEARSLSKELKLKYETRSIAGHIDLKDGSQDLILDMMTSHFLNYDEREELHKEIARILKPGGWLYFKTFFLDEDAHAKRLIREQPAKERGSYIHPKIGVAEHAFTEKEIQEMLSKNFRINKMLRSHRHRDEHGHAGKRRSISVYAERI